MKAIFHQLTDMLKTGNLNYNEDVVKKLMCQSVWQKRKLARKLGLNKSNDFRVMIGTAESDARTICSGYVRVCDYIQDFCAAKYRELRELSDSGKNPSLKEDYAHVYNHKFECVVNNTTKSGMKLSKLLKNNGFVDWLGEDRKIAIFDKFDFQRDRKDEAIIPTIFEKLNNRNKGDEIWITINPADFIGVNHNATYSSCLSFTGEYFNTTISYIRDDFTVLVYRWHNGQKIGRMWLYIDMENSFMFQPCTYGTLNNPDKKLARTWVQDKLGGDEKWRRLQESSMYSNHCGYMYTDSASVYTNKYPWLDSGRIKLEFKDPTCLNCGYVVDQPVNGVCQSCDDSISCYECGSRHSEDDMTYSQPHDRWYCQHCADAYLRYCDSCSEWHRDCDTTWVESLNSYYCEDCRDNDLGYCDICRDYYITDNTREFEGEYYCDDCFDSKIEECKDCSADIKISDSHEVDGDYYCDDCHNEKESEKENNEKIAVN